MKHPSRRQHKPILQCRRRTEPAPQSPIRCPLGFVFPRGRWAEWPTPICYPGCRGSSSSAEKKRDKIRWIDQRPSIILSRHEQRILDAGPIPHISRIHRIYIYIRKHTRTHTHTHTHKYVYKVDTHYACICNDISLKNTCLSTNIYSLYMCYMHYILVINV